MVLRRSGASIVLHDLGVVPEVTMCFILRWDYKNNPGADSQQHF